jgi:serine/threonine protein kinase
LEGATLKGYQLRRVVGKGGMAWVYEAVHPQLGEKMAVKILLPHLADNPGIRERFIDEARIQFKVKHPNIVQVTDVIEEDDVIGMVMEWIDGENLEQLLSKRQQALSRKDVWRVMGPILDAVGYAHQRGLVHRDIKPPNILLHREDNLFVPKIADFGIAKLLNAGEQKTGTGEILGTIKYMAPEQIQDSKSVDHRADIYALGMTLYVMTTLRYPFEGEQAWIIFQTMHEAPPPPSHYNPALTGAFDRVVMRSLSKSPEDRFQNCAELAHALSLALLASENIAKDRDINSLDIYNMLSALPEENSIYESKLEPLSPNLMQVLLEHNDTALAIQKYVFEDLPTLVQGQDRQLQRVSASAKAVDDTKIAYNQRGLRSADHITHLQKTGDPNSRETNRPRVWSLTAVTIGIALLLLFGFSLYFITVNQSKPTQMHKAKANDTASTNANTTCKVGDTRPCYTGPVGTRDIGICRAGVQHCRDGSLGDCTGQILPKPELCNGLDDNCNGQIDETFLDKGKACDASKGDCKLPGTWVCADDHSKLICKVSQGSDILGSKQLWLDISPPKVAFTLHYVGKQSLVSGRYCIERTERGSKLRLTRRGYYTCSFVLPHKQQIAKIKMKPESPHDLDPPLRYCLQ